MNFWESTVWLMCVVGIVTILSLCLVSFIILFFSIKQVKIKFKQKTQNKKLKKQLEKHKQKKDKEYFDKMDKLLKPNKSKKEV
jgi:hypothetical protein